MFRRNIYSEEPLREGGMAQYTGKNGLFSQGHR